LYGRRIANRCDYRRLITKDENVNNCRDANEDHNMGFDDIGCDPQYRNQIGQAIPEDDSVCWEIERFGFTENAFPPGPAPSPNPPSPIPVPPTAPPPTSPTPPSPNPEPPTATPPTSPTPCVNNSGFTWNLDFFDVDVNCNWLTKNKKKRNSRISRYCPRADISSNCPISCNACPNCRDDTDFTFILNWNGNEAKCDWLTLNNNKIQQRRNVYCGTIGSSCPLSCGNC